MEKRWGSGSGTGKKYGSGSDAFLMAYYSEKCENVFLFMRLRLQQIKGCDSLWLRLPLRNTDFKFLDFSTT
jgi:hypothetical protein